MVGFSDLALETEFLASLNHPHIMKLRGLAFSGTSGFETGPTGYFLIIDRLFETLVDRIQRWRWEKSSAVVGKGRSLSFRRSFRLGGPRSVSVGRLSARGFGKASSFPSSTIEAEAEDTQVDERLSVGEYDCITCLIRITIVLCRHAFTFHLFCLCSLSRYVLIMQLSR